MEQPKVRCRLIVEADLDGIADCLARGFPHRPRSYFLAGMQRQAARTVPEGLPRWGYMLEHDGRPVGAVLLMVSARSGGAGIRCNIASWYVDPPFRSHAAWLSSMALKHKGMTYLNVTPAASTWPILEAQGYQRYCSGLFAALPALAGTEPGVTVERVGPGTTAVAGLSDEETALLASHAAYGCTSLVCRTADGPLPFILLPFRIRSGRVPMPAMQLIHARSTEDFVRVAGTIGRWLLPRLRPVVLIDSNGPIPGLPGLYTERRGRKYFKGPDRPRLADLTDTELVVFGP